MPEIIFIVVDIDFSTINGGVRWVDMEGPGVELQINNFKPGRYIFSIYGDGPDASSDSVYYGIGGVLVGAVSLDVYVSPGPKWSSTLQGGGTSYITIPSNGQHTISLWGREDGTSVTKVRIE